MYFLFASLVHLLFASVVVVVFFVGVVRMRRIIRTVSSALREKPAEDDDNLF